MQSTSPRKAPGQQKPTSSPTSIDGTAVQPLARGELANLAAPFAGETMSYRDALFISMDSMLRSQPNTIILGQGADDFKGVFGSTVGLVEKYGTHRVMDTPLAEEGITGIGIGAALNGLYPIMIHIRADFALVAMNQIVNLAAKYKYMFGGRFETPLLIRMVVGRSWGQGAQHSQSPQSLFAHIPGLTVIMPSNSQSILESYPYIAHYHKGPVISIEHRLMYDVKFEVQKFQQFRGENPLASRFVREGEDVTVVSTSIMTLEATRAAEFLKQHAGISAEIIDVHNVTHYDREMILASVRKTGKLLIADTSWKAFGVCAEISRLIVENDPSMLKAPVRTLGMAPAPCPTAKSLEDLYYPNLTNFCDQIAKLVTGKEKHGVNVPDERSMADVYKKFRGPF